MTRLLGCLVFLVSLLLLTSPLPARAHGNHVADEPQLQDRAIQSLLVENKDGSFDLFTHASLQPQDGRVLFYFLSTAFPSEEEAPLSETPPFEVLPADKNPWEAIDREYGASSFPPAPIAAITGDARVFNPGHEDATAQLLEHLESLNVQLGTSGEDMLRSKMQGFRGVVVVIPVEPPPARFSTPVVRLRNLDVEAENYSFPILWTDRFLQNSGIPGKWSWQKSILSPHAYRPELLDFQHNTFPVAGRIEVAGELVEAQYLSQFAASLELRSVRSLMIYLEQTDQEQQTAKASEVAAPEESPAEAGGLLASIWNRLRKFLGRS